MGAPGAMAALEDAPPFSERHIGPRTEDVEAMLRLLGLASLEALVHRAVPASILAGRPLELPSGVSEAQAIARLREIAGRNRIATSMIGMGYYGTVTPAVIQRNVLESPAWYTAYTPYQAEVSQGRLEALLNYQQMVIDLTGMEIANASLLDEATAAAEAMAMSRRLSRSRSEVFLADADTHPQTLAVLETRAAALGIELVVTDVHERETLECFGMLVQYPGSSGRVRSPASVIERAHCAGALVTVASDLMALVLLRSPGELGADVVVGSTQRFGVPMGFGGPHAAFFATRDANKRSTPGRLIGVSVDGAGRPALRMALQTREQHIRREKATSNICTAQVLLAVIASFYAVYHGPEGLARIAARIHRMTAALAEGLRAIGFGVENAEFFDTLTVAAPARARELVAAAGRAGINLREVDDDSFGVSLDEATTAQDLSALLAALAPGTEVPDLGDLVARAPDGIAPGQRRTDTVLTHPVFHAYRSETEMLRYIRRLAHRDLALDRAMIPLGSCTMKLNATTEMLPVTWPEFSAIHPFAPPEQTAGYRELLGELEKMLCACTGFDAVSLQPNAGSQGEYAGLLVIRRYHQSRGEGRRAVCLIPASAHGTNPASAQMAGLEVVVVACDRHGNVDVADLKRRAEAAGDRLAALMLTYPSTHGVFEAAVREICEVIHAHGGQVYMDGANLNALLGLSLPADIGADVSHINLHKTFCIPHGGGGPGMGPIGVRAHLAPFLPAHPVVAGVNAHADPAAGAAGRPIGPVSAAPWGSASILPISWAYIAMMGGPGLRRATEIAILNANYVATRLSGHFEVLYTGQNGMVAHECIIDLRDVKERAGVNVDDVAKRLVDYGFHAPTMSFPVADTLMIEPTESESKAELDRFCGALIAIRREIADIEDGRSDRIDNPLKNAPHTYDDLVAEDWAHPYSRETAVFPSPTSRADKYWPPVGRIDNVYGDRNLVCTCPPMAAYAAD